MLIVESIMCVFSTKREKTSEVWQQYWNRKSWLDYLPCIMCH